MSRGKAEWCHFVTYTMNILLCVSMYTYIRCLWGLLYVYTTGGYFTSPGDNQLVKDSMLSFCKEVCLNCVYYLNAIMCVISL